MDRKPLQDINFSEDLHDRMTDRRDDREFVETAWKDPATRVLVADGRGRLATDDDGGLGLVGPDAAPGGERLLLGTTRGVVHFLVLADPDEAGVHEGAGDPGRPGERAGSGDGDSAPPRPFATLRELFGRLEPWQASLAVHAVGIANWHRSHPRCSVCGAPTQVVGAGESRRCPDCGASHFPRTDPAVIMLVVDDDDRMLLGHNGARPENWFSALAGFVEPGESLEAAVRREVAEEVGLVVDDVTYVGSQPWPLPSSLMLGFFAHTSDPAYKVDGVEITDARWFTRSELERAARSGEVVIPSSVSIARTLIEDWYGAELPGTWG